MTSEQARQLLHNADGRVQGCLPFVRVNRLGWPLNNGKGFSKTSKPTERDGAYRLKFDFS